MSPVIFYDPAERVVATLHANHTYEKEVFDPWRRKTYDVNDTVALDPRTDPDISGLVTEYFKQVAPQPDDWRSWLRREASILFSTPRYAGVRSEKKAASAPCPMPICRRRPTSNLLGRTFLGIVHNKFRRKKPDDTFETIEEKYQTELNSILKAIIAQCAMRSCRTATSWTHCHAPCVRHAGKSYTPGEHGCRRALDD